MRLTNVARARQTDGRSTFVAWLDLSTEDLDEWIRLLDPRPDDTVDELGLGVLAEKISERLYPALNVTMRRARYLIFVASIYRHLEILRVPATRVPSRREELENLVRRALSKRESSDVHGVNAGEDLKRYPSSIYWRALGDLGIFLHDESERDYIRRLDDWHRAQRGLVTDDRKPVRDEYVGPNWDQRLPVVPLHPKPKSLRFKLTRREADYLRERIVGRYPESLLAHCLESRRRSQPAWPWDCRPGGELATILAHARPLSAFARGATLLYFHILLEKREKKAELPAIKDALDRWHHEATDILRGWDVSALPEAIRPIDRWATDRRFLEVWTDRCLTARTGRELVRDPSARAEIEARDRRRKRSRFSDRLLLMSWDPRAAKREANREEAFRFGYRHGIGQRVVRDILESGGTRGAGT